MQKDDTKHIVILGGGFGGIYTLLHLRKHFPSCKFKITLISRTNYFLFTPMLHEVATGGLNAFHVAESIRQIIMGCDITFLQEKVKEVDLEERIVTTNEVEIPYDYLVISLGSKTTFHNIPGAEKNSLVLDTLQDARKMRRHFIDVFEKASTIEDVEKRREYLTFAVVGGGATGVELVAEMAELFFDTFNQYYENHMTEKDATLYIINRGDELIKQFPKYMRDKSQEALKKMNVKIVYNCAVKQVSEDAITLEDGEEIKVRHKIWTAGVSPNTPKIKQDIALDHANRIIVDQYLRVRNYENVFAVGDVASFSGEDGNPLPMLAQVAVKEGATAGHNIACMMKGKSLRSFKYKSPGLLLSLGQWKAAGHIKGLNMSGKVTWVLWRGVYLSKFASWSNRLKIAIDWVINIFYPRDITKI